MATLAARSGGAGWPLLLLLHGLGANGAVWNDLLPLVERDWAGRWLAPDLRGHGRSPHEQPYGLATMAADVAALIADERGVTILGHSMGGAIAILLASGLFGVRPRRTALFAVKGRWDAAMVDRFAGLATSPPRDFATRDDAVARYLASSGLKGLVSADAETVSDGIVAHGAEWRLAMDPGANAVAGMTVSATTRALDVPLLVAVGERDPIVSREEAADLIDAPLILAGLGHNPHVEDAAALWMAVEPFLNDR